MNVFDFAMEMEVTGKAHYEKLAAETEVPGLKSIFKHLADDEQKHFNTLRSMKGGAYGEVATSKVLDEAKNVFQGLGEDRALAGTLQKDVEGYRYALKIEEDSVQLYEDMARKETNSEAVQLLLKIAEEEKKHLTILQNLNNYLLTPMNVQGFSG